ncbi:MAG: tetratricopeptide repeat protein [Myxococcota bacterium]|nr:tetratricopeptide repeat protein [Myxococcota bacterium]
MQRFLIVLVLALAAALPASLSRAQDASGSAEAQALFRRGVELGEQDRWAEALEDFRRSRALAERPNTVFNIGFALYRLGRYSQAIDVFEEYLALTEGETSERRDEVVRLRGEAIASLAEIELEVVPPDARVLVDGEPAVVASGSPRTLRLDPGRHVLRGTAPGYEEGVLSTSVLAGEHGGRTLALTPRGAIPPGGEGRPPAGGSVLEEPLFWVIAGVLVVGAGVGIGVGVAVSSEGAPLYGGSTGVVIDALRF